MIELQEFADKLGIDGWKLRFPLPDIPEDRKHFIITRTEEALQWCMEIIRIVVDLDFTRKKDGSLTELLKELKNLHEKFII